MGGYTIFIIFKFIFKTVYTLIFIIKQDLTPAYKLVHPIYYCADTVRELSAQAFVIAL
jgi:hypothetical protein